MAEERVQRRLAAILAADVVGYSRLMGADEEGTLARLKKLRADVIEPKTSGYGGRIFKTTGDGVLAEFASAVDAVRHAIDVQNAINILNGRVPEEDRIVFRMGISLGDVMVEGDDLFGNGVNVAARMEGLADAGGICISGNVQEHIASLLDVTLEDLGEQTVKNIERPVRCYRVRLDRGDIADVSLPLPDKPSIAVLPFENISGDPEQEYFADGLTEDLTAAMASWKAFPVIGRNSSFTFKNKRAPAREVCRTLGARYLVDGSVRKSGNRIRISCGLVDGESGNHLWSQRYDRELSDVFDLQDEITRTIAVTLEPELEKAVLDRSGGKTPADLNAWDYWLRGMTVLSEFNREATPRARELFEKAIEIDPGYARAAAYISFTYHRELLMQAAVDVNASATKCLEWAQYAVRLDSGDYVSHWALALAYMQTGDSPRMLEEARNAYLMNPNRLESIRTMGTALLNNGHASEAIPYLEDAIRLNPVDTRNRMHSRTAALAHFHSGNYVRTVELARQAISAGVDYADIDWILVAALGHQGENEMAQKTLQQLGLPNRIPVEFQYPAHARLPIYKLNIIDGLRKAGVSE